MKKLPKYLAILTLSVLVLTLVFTAFSRIDGAQQDRNMENLTQALRRGAVSCYAQEGFYPPDLDFLLSYSGVRYDPDRYFVRYEIFASNLMPDITVIEKSYEK